MNNKEVIDAINTVIRVDYKYEAPAAFKTVERAGYNTYKYSGTWVVRSPKTWKSVRRGYKGGLALSHGANVKAENADKVDIINYLDTPVNREWYDELNKNVWGTPTQDKMRKLRWKKEAVAEREAELDKLAKQLETARKAYIQASKELLVFKVQNRLEVR